jgi:hypothetical protein
MTGKEIKNVIPTTVAVAEYIKNISSVPEIPSEIFYISSFNTFDNNT